MDDETGILTKEGAMYHFMSGYTSKLAGTERGIKEPKSVFSQCFGAPFMPLHPTKYAEMLGNKMQEHNVNVWLINTGWSGGEYGVGSRISLKYTPRLHFHLDDSLEKGDNILSILDEINKNKK